MLSFTHDDFASFLRLGNLWDDLIQTGYTTNLIINTDLDDADIRALISSRR